MARIELHFPESTTTFATQIQVRISEINYGNHLANDSVLSICHEARLQWLYSLHYKEMDVEGTGLIMADAAIIFRNEAFHGDVLTVHVSVDDVQRVSFDLYYKLMNGTKIIAIVKTGMVFFNYTDRKVCSCPERFLQKLT